MPRQKKSAEKAQESPVFGNDGLAMALVRCPICRGHATRLERWVKGYKLERCLECQMVFQNPQCTDEALEQIYDDRDVDELIHLYERIATESFLAEYNKKLAEL